MLSRKTSTSPHAPSPVSSSLLLPLLPLLGIVVGLAASASAESKGPGQGRRGPPPEAVEACADADDGDACSFAGREGDEVKGTCRQPPRAAELVCVPEGHGPPPSSKSTSTSTSTSTPTANLSNAAGHQ